MHLVLSKDSSKSGKKLLATALLATFIILALVGASFLIIGSKASEAKGANPSLLNQGATEVTTTLTSSPEALIKVRPNIIFNNQTLLKMSGNNFKVPTKLIEDISIKPELKLSTNKNGAHLDKYVTSYEILAYLDGYWINVGSGVIKNSSKSYEIKLNFTEIGGIVSRASREAGLPEQKSITVLLNFHTNAIVRIDNKLLSLRPESSIKIVMGDVETSFTRFIGNKSATVRIEEENTTIIKDSSSSKWWLPSRSVSIMMLASGIIGLPLAGIYRSTLSSEVIPRDLVLGEALLDEKIPRITLKDQKALRELAEKLGKPILMLSDENKACVVDNQVAYCSSL